MELQSIVYIVAIVFMVLWILFLTVGIAILWKIFDEIRNAPQRLEEKISEIFESKVMGIVTAVGIPLVGVIAKKIKDKMGRNDEE